jgi:hypothetical protein
VVVADSGPVLCEPLVASAPFQPPEAVQDVAFVDDHDNTEAAPLVTVVGAAVSVTTGAGALTDTVADWAALPPEPLHVKL